MRVDQVGHAARVRHLLHDAAADGRLDLPLGPEDQPRARGATACVKPALVQSSGGSTGCPRRPGGDGAARRLPRASQRSPVSPLTTTRRPIVGRFPVPGRSRPGLDGNGSGVRPGRERDESREQQARESAEHDTGCRRERRAPSASSGGGSTRLGARSSARRAEEHEADHLDEAQHRQRHRRGERRESDGSERAVPDARVRGYVQERLQRQPFRGEAVEQRHARDRERADEERRRRSTASGAGAHRGGRARARRSPARTPRRRGRAAP